MFNKEKPVETIVDKQKCTKCGLCLEVCATYLSKDEQGFPCPQTLDKSLFGCIQCGHCMMICPNEAIEIRGEDIDNSRIRNFGAIPDYDSLNNLLLKRRSIRKFKEQEVSQEMIEKIINSAATAAVSIPPSEVKILVINGAEKVQELAEDMIKPMKSFLKLMNPLTLNLLKITAGKNTYKMFKDFVLPLCKETIEKRKEGLDYLFYNAPCVIIFYGTELTDKEDMLLAANTATIAAESLSLGTCYIGMLGAIMQMNSKLRLKYGIEKTDKVGTAFILGHPDIKFNRAFQRKFKEVRFIK